MNIAIIGKGTASIITALVLMQKNYNISIFYDPKTSHINVGESTTPHIQELILNTLGINIHEIVDLGIFSYKMGINFVNWGCGKSFHHNFADSGIAHHFETKQFNEFVHNYLEKNKLVTYFSERVDNIDSNSSHVIINKKVFDFVVNCAGWENEDSYITPFFSSVNSAQLFTEEYDYDNTHTLHLATEDGWQFGLPFPQKNIFKCGYLYNKDLISHEQVSKKLNKNVYETFSWTPRYSKQLLTHPLIALNGNRLFFLEPLQALSLYYTYYFATLISDYLDYKTQEKYDSVNYCYLLEMWTYQLSLAYHYQYGSIYNTEFWEKTKNNAINVIKSSPNGNIDVFKMNLERDGRFDYGYSKIGCFGFKDLTQIHFGMTQEQNNLNKFLKYK